MQGDLKVGDVKWFAGGKLNACYNALDRHNPDDLAVIWEGDEPDDIRKITYGQMVAKVSSIANALKKMGVKKGDVVTIYMVRMETETLYIMQCFSCASFLNYF